VSRATIKRYLKQRRETGSVAPKAIPGRPPKQLGPLQTELVEQLRAHDDRRLEEYCQLWEQTHGVKVSPTTMSRAIKRVGWTRKKRRWVPPNAAKQSASAGVSR
jgi:transposase